MNLACSLILLAGCSSEPPVADPPEAHPVPQIKFAPRVIAAPRWTMPARVDGVVEEAWDAIPWSEPFVDIEGVQKATPTWNTRVKMAWTVGSLFILAEIEEPHIWANLTERDSVIFHDNDFELFIDPNDDTHGYYELEVNALGTEWDLYLEKPYRDGGPALNAFNFFGLRTAIGIDGTLNDPSDVDRGWIVEIEIPWRGINLAPDPGTPPAIGDRWRINFSRVEWQTEIRDGQYVKLTDDSGEPLAESNWVWSPQGLINMHYPEMWGFVEFVKSPQEPSPLSRLDLARWALRKLYYRQHEIRAETGCFAMNLDESRDPAFDEQAQLSGVDCERFLISTTVDGIPIQIDAAGQIVVGGSE